MEPEVMTAHKAVPVLMYHEIASATDTASRLAVPPDAFAAQLSYLHDHGFTPLTAGRLAAALASEGQGLPARPIVLTFDDGFADFHASALPLLRRMAIMARAPTTMAAVPMPMPGRAGARAG